MSTQAPASLRSSLPGAAGLEARAELLASRLPNGLKPLAAVAYNYRWSWSPLAADVFRSIDSYRWAVSGRNPVVFLERLAVASDQATEPEPALSDGIARVAAEHAAELERPDRPRPGIDGPIAFFCAEFGVHASLPTYAGGLGVLAGDILKEASDQALPMLGIGLFYRRGYFRQRLDQSGWQQEHWPEIDPETLAMALVDGPEGRPLRLAFPVFGRPVAVQVWRVDVGRVPLFLLDCELPENDPVQRWTTARLYEGNREVRLAQYGVLGVGGSCLLRALGVEPAVLHLNEGHPALAAVECAADLVERGWPLEDALASVRSRVVFTTHTPVPAGNETYAPDEFLSAFGDLARRLELEDDEFLGLCRIDPADPAERPGMSPLAIRLSRTRNGVSRLHGQVARRMWQLLFPESSPDDVPITHVTNGAHLPTFVARPLRRLFERHLGEGWLERAAEPSAWEAVRGIPNEELWAARSEARAELVGWVRAKAQRDRLLRGEQIAYVRAIAQHLDPDVLTLGFARRLATYKRLYLLFHDPERAVRLLTGERSVQLVLAGKAHPSDDEGKQVLQRLHTLRRGQPELAGRVAFLEDYDLEVSRRLIAGCDVWINLPRKPMEASGTSGMKAAFNGQLQLSVLDGWWAEAFNGVNGWGIPGDEDADPAAADARDAAAFYDLLENEVIPSFYDRDASGVPHAWCERVKESLATCTPMFSATRMLDDYVERVYRVPG